MMKAAMKSRRGRGAASIANRLLRRVRDFAQVNEEPIITRQVALGALELLEIDAMGSTKWNRAILATSSTSLTASGRRREPRGDVARARHHRGSL